MIAEIIPAVRLPRNLNRFSYLIPEELAGVVRVGMVAEIDFRGRKAEGLIIGIKNYELRIKGKDKLNLKPINKIIFPAPLITLAQIELIKEIAEYYGVSEGIVCRSFLPKIPKRKLRMYKSYECTNGGKTDKKTKTTTKLLWWHDVNERNKEYKEIIKNTKKQILILTPQIDFIDGLIRDLKLNEKEVIKIHNKIGPADFFENWLKILSGETKIVIGTKMAVTLPFSNLKTIIVDEEQDWNHKQSDINPRYDARTVAEWLAEKSGAKLVLASAAPRVETYHKLKSEIRNQEKRFLGSGFGVEVTAINMVDEKTKGNYSLISDLLEEKIGEVLAAGKKVFLLHNRKGMAGFVFCRDCGFVFKCPECQISFGYFQAEQKMKCRFCGKKEEVPPFCPKCGGPNIDFKIKGVEDLASEIQKKFPENSVAAVFQEEGIKKDFVAAEIVCGTEFALNKIDWLKVGLTAVVNFEQFVGRPDFRAEKRTFDFLAGMAAKLTGELVVQAGNLENLVLQSLKKNDAKIFYEAELKNRQELNYSPFWRVIKIIFQDGSKAKAYYLLDKLAREIKDKEKGWKVDGPFAAMPEKIRGNFFYNLVVRLPEKEKFDRLFKMVPPDFVVDVEPEKLM